jgi:hypothetical protein
LQKYTARHREHFLSSANDASQFKHRGRAASAASSLSDSAYLSSIVIVDIERGVDD